MIRERIILTQKYIPEKKIWYRLGENLSKNKFVGAQTSNSNNSQVRFSLKTQRFSTHKKYFDITHFKT